MDNKTTCKHCGRETVDNRSVCESCAELWAKFYSALMTSCIESSPDGSIISHTAEIADKMLEQWSTRWGR